MERVLSDAALRTASPRIWHRWALVLFAIFLFAPAMGLQIGDSARLIIIELAAFVLLAGWLVQTNWTRSTIQSVVFGGPGLPLVLLVGWAALSFFATASNSGRAGSIATIDLLRLFAGASVYFATIHFWRGRKAVYLLPVLLLGAIVSSAAGVWSWGATSSMAATGGYGNKQLLAAYLVVLFPVSLVMVLGGGRKSLKRLAWIAMPLIVGALILTGNRTSWIAACFSIAVIACAWGWMKWKASPVAEGCAARRSRARIVLWATMLIAGGISIAIVLDGGNSLRDRLNVRSAATTFGARVRLWSACVEMVREKPVMGWGIGSFATESGKYNRSDLPSASIVEAEGSSLSSIAHNEYLQIAAELGLVGLALYVSILAAFFWRALKALPNVHHFGSRLVLLASVAAIAAQCVDAMANPGWHFGDVSPVFWLMMGLGMAVVAPRVPGQRREEVNAEVSSGNRIYLLARRATAVAVPLAFADGLIHGVTGGGVAFAAYVNWDNDSTNGQWSTGLNWSTNVVPNGSQGVAFPASIPGSATITLVNGESANSLEFSNDYTLTGGTLTISGPGGGPIDTPNGVTATINSSILGGQGITKTGTGILILGGSNSFTGTVNIIGGLFITADNNLGNASNGISYPAFGSLHCLGSFPMSRTITPGPAGGQIEVGVGDTVTLNASIAANANTFASAGPGILDIAVASSRTGPSIITTGTVRLTNAAGLGTAGTAQILAGGVLEVVGGTNAVLPVELEQSGGIRAFNGLGVYGGIATVDPSATVNLMGGANSTDTLRIGNAVANTYTGGSSANTIVTGPGTVYVLNNNNYAGDWEVDSGTLRVGSPSSLGSGSSAVVANNGASLKLDVGSFTRPITLNNVSTLLASAGGVCTASGGVTVGSSASVTLSTATSADTLLLSGFPQVSGPASSTVHISGPGTVSFPNANSSFLGTWQLDGGTLHLDNAAALGSNPTPAVIINAATLELTTGNLNKNLTLNTGAIVRGVGTPFAGRTFAVANSASVTLSTSANPTDVFSLNVGSQTITGGTGSTLHIAGAGKVFVAQDNSYSGDWSVDSGVLEIGGFNAVGTGSSPMLVNSGATLLLSSPIGRDVTLSNGATLETSISLSTQGALNFPSGTATVNSDTGSIQTQSGVISGAGSLSKIGAGTLHITNAANNLSGSVLIDAGTIEQAGGNTTVSGLFRVASSLSSSTGAYTLSSGTLNVINNAIGVNGEAIGFNGTGSFNQTGGTHLVNGANGNLVIGYSGTAVGTYTISSGSLTANSLYIARDPNATGTLTQNGGTITVATEFLDIGLGVGGTGTVNANAGSLTALGIYVGGVSSQQRGTGILNVAGGSVTSSGELRVWDTVNSAIVFSAGNLTADSLNTSGNPSRVNWNGGTLTITGTGGFTVGPTGPLSSALALGATQTLAVNHTTTIAANSSLTVHGNFQTGSLTGVGALTVHSTASVGSDSTSTTFTGPITGSGTLTKVGTGSLNITNIRTAGLAVNAGRVHILPSGDSAASTSSLKSAPTVGASARLDLDDNTMVINYIGPTPLTAVRTLVLKGRGPVGFGNATWNGAGGITSSKASPSGQGLGGIGNGVDPAIGYGENSAMPIATFTTFNGQTVNSSSILIKYTRGADATLDGKVDNSDVTVVGTEFNNPASGQWYLGDFDYSGMCDNSDVTALGTLFNPTQPPLSPAQLNAEFGSAFAQAFAAGQAMSQFAAVPEPSMVVLLSFAVSGLGFRRRRRVWGSA